MTDEYLAAYEAVVNGAGDASSDEATDRAGWSLSLGKARQAALVRHRATRHPGRCHSVRKFITS